MISVLTLNSFNSSIMNLVSRIHYSSILDELLIRILILPLQVCNILQQQNVYVYAKMQLSTIIENNGVMHGRENAYQIQLTELPVH